MMFLYLLLNSTIQNRNTSDRPKLLKAIRIRTPQEGLRSKLKPSVQTSPYGPTHSAFVLRARNKTCTCNLNNKPQKKIEVDITHTRGQSENK